MDIKRMHYSAAGTIIVKPSFRHRCHAAGSGRRRGGCWWRGSGIKRWQHKSEQDTYIYVHIAASWKGKWKVPHSNRLGIGILALV